jgi:hypothetical protein
MKTWQTSFKQNTQGKRKNKKGTKRENLSPSPNLNPKWVTKVQRNKSCFKGPPLIARNILEKEKKDEKT